MELSQFNFAGDPSERTETWERMLTRGDARSGEKMSDHIRISISTLLLEDGPIG